MSAKEWLRPTPFPPHWRQFISSVGWIKGISVADTNGPRYLLVDPPIKVEPGDSFTVSPKTGRVRVTRYEDALLEPEWEIFV